MAYIKDLEPKRSLFKVAGLTTVLYVVILIGIAKLITCWQPLDETDLDREHRSGVTPIIDYGTGCQYLKITFGGVTPRLDTSGKQICRPLVNQD